MIRQLKGYKQEYLAEKLSVSQKQYSLYEKSNSNLEWHTIERIAIALEIDVVKLIDFDENRILNKSSESDSTSLFSNTQYLNKEMIEELIHQLSVKDEQIRVLLAKR